MPQIETENSFSIRKWKLILSTVLAIAVIGAQAFVLIQDRITVFNHVETNSLNIKELKEILKKHIELPSHLYSGFQLSRLQEDMKQMSADMKELMNMLRKLLERKNIK